MSDTKVQSICFYIPRTDLNNESHAERYRHVWWRASLTCNWTSQMSARFSKIRAYIVSLPLPHLLRHLRSLKCGASEKEDATRDTDLHHALFANRQSALKTPQATQVGKYGVHRPLTDSLTSRSNLGSASQTQHHSGTKTPKGPPTWRTTHIMRRPQSTKPLDPC